MNFSEEPYKYIDEYIEYFILIVENADFKHKDLFLIGINSIKEKEHSDELILFLREIHYNIYDEIKCEFVDYNNFYRCKELDLPIKDYNIEK